MARFGLRVAKGIEPLAKRPGRFLAFETLEWRQLLCAEGVVTPDDVAQPSDEPAPVIADAGDTGPGAPAAVPADSAATSEPAPSAAPQDDSPAADSPAAVEAPLDTSDSAAPNEPGATEPAENSDADDTQSASQQETQPTSAPAEAATGPEPVEPAPATAGSDEDEPGDDEPVAEAPVDDEPVDDEPVDEEQVDEEEAPVDEEQVDDASAAQQASDDESDEEEPEGEDGAEGEPIEGLPDEPVGIPEEPVDHGPPEDPNEDGSDEEPEGEPLPNDSPDVPAKDQDEGGSGGTGDKLSLAAAGAMPNSALKGMSRAAMPSNGGLSLGQSLDETLRPALVAPTLSAMAAASLNDADASAPGSLEAEFGPASFDAIFAELGNGQHTAPSTIRSSPALALDKQSPTFALAAPPRLVGNRDSEENAVPEASALPIEQAFNDLLREMDDFAEQLTGSLGDINYTPWSVALAATVVAGGVARQHFRQDRLRMPSPGRRADTVSAEFPELLFLADANP